VIYNSTTGGENQSPAPVESAGFEWLRGSFVVRPEFRYIRYRESFGSNVDVGRPENPQDLGSCGGLETEPKEKLRLITMSSPDG
jgi:hypothetical protein